MKLNSTPKPKTTNPVEESGLAARDYCIVEQTETRGKRRGLANICVYIRFSISFKNTGPRVS